jgi:hypothetical protein
MTRTEKWQAAGDIAGVKVLVQVGAEGYRGKKGLKLRVPYTEVNSVQGCADALRYITTTYKVQKVVVACPKVVGNVRFYYDEA